ncbi:hypothetical protein ABID12_000426 [Martelella mangrovi]|uniref:Uncharacterized protein n=1 Tax=Martelella mangrovi TaxID=1397477 RepID=A0ABV2I6K9_9HYPH
MIKCITDIVPGRALYGNRENSIFRICIFHIISFLC